MILKLYLANFPPEAAEEQIQAVFAPVGPASRVKILDIKNMEYVGGHALLWLETEQEISDVLSQVNGYLWDGYRLCLSPTKPSSMPAEPTAEQQQFAESLAAKLGELEPEPCQQILDIVRLCTAAFAQAVLDDTLDVEERGGMVVRDGSRPRTRGGVFFYLARGRLSFGMQQVIVPHLRQKAAEQRTAQPKQKPLKTGQPMTVPLPPEEEMIAIRQKLVNLRCEHASAQSLLDQLKTQPPHKQTGMFSAIKQVLDIQRQIDMLMKANPFLNGS